MARGLPKWKKLLNLERLATSAFSGTEEHFPVLTSAIGYHGRRGPPSRTAFSSVSRHDLRIGTSPYRALYEEVTKAQVDLSDKTVNPFVVTATTWMIPDVVVPGHTLRMIETKSGTQLSSKAPGTVRWAYSHPFPFPQRPVRCRGVIATIPASETNYYHLVTNQLLPLAHALLRHREDLSGTKIQLAVCKLPSVVQRVVEALRTRGLDIDILDVKPTDRLDGEFGWYASTHHPAGHPSHGYWTGPEGEELIAALDRIVPAIDTPAKVHIPRTQSHVRKIDNNDELLSCIDSNGFAPLDANWGNFDLQYRTFRQAREIVAVHGAGLTNLCWSRPETRVTEITPTNARRSHFLQIASERGVNFRYFFAGEEAKKQNFGVDVPALDAQLKAA